MLSFKEERNEEKRETKKTEEKFFSLKNIHNKLKTSYISKKRKINVFHHLSHKKRKIMSLNKDDHIHRFFLL